MKRILLDQGLAPLAAAILCGDGWEAVHVSDIGMDRASDEEILDAARNENRVCVTLDHDFHAHLALARSGQPSVVLLRTEGLDQAQLICAVWNVCEETLALGAAVSADGAHVRIGRLPLV